MFCIPTRRNRDLITPNIISISSLYAFVVSYIQRATITETKNRIPRKLVLMFLRQKSPLSVSVWRKR